jgi:hypothetical protein
MDKFIKENNFRSAAVIASNQMLQEELDNDVVSRLVMSVGSGSAIGSVNSSDH